MIKAKVNISSILKNFSVFSERKKNLIFILLIIFISSIYNSYLIIYFPGFFYDDFSIFRIIKEFINTGSYISVDEKFFLFWRPVAFFFFLIEYLFFGNNPVFIKFFILFLNSLFLISTYYALLFLFDFIRLNNGRGFAFLTVLCLNFHPVTSYYFLFISQQNSLIMCLFLVCSFISIMKLVKTNKLSWGITSVLFYSLSLLSKQHSASYPLIILILFFVYRSYFNNKVKKKIKLIISLNLIITIIYFLLFYLLSDSLRIYFFTYIHKKPFVIASSVLYFLFPYKFFQIYDFFMYNYYISVISFISLIILLLLFIIKVKKIRIFLIIAFVFAMSFFPQILMDNTPRNLNIQILVLLISTVILFIYKYKTILVYFLIFSLVIYFLSSIENAEIIKRKSDYTDYSVDKFLNTFKNNYGNYLIVLTFGNFMFNDFLYYKLYKDFGRFDLNILNVDFVLKESEILGYNKLQELAYVSKFSDTLYYRSIHEIAYFTFLPEEYIIKFNNKYSSKYIRSFKLVIPEEYQKKKLLYFNGVEWKEIP